MTKATHCWQCGKHLIRHPRTKRLIFVLVEGMRTHKICKRNAEIAIGKRHPMPDVEEGATPPARTE